jgi:two-component system response regulator (stage 0 sporulation protein A)
VKVDVVLLDIMMPKIDGIGVLQTLKDQKKKLPKIIMLTNLSHDGALKEAESLGAKECIIKSEVTPDQVLEKINKLLA